ncbi:PREDICTED: DNA-directed RNA polymerases I and III subunit RPAC1 isoform X2 [Trachymyrmex cornetzi]|uniref:DNA-directed RNA polymerases I and III subunit RPAC1 n=2 Tax=Trachymyrmex cornetzi TaxID=471704 RepID=A0A195DMH3_9HYME|nr:PREDICTED: DNA-directed RNA polymerases I and III subunit RPAC1 isoform X2 [Trachymyrmex cornetzi]KYN14083.1 DNA-directed RNA polymerases I and III subunit RPAC1 [Trachymyrmex cornetzi]
MENNQEPRWIMKEYENFEEYMCNRTDRSMTLEKFVKNLKINIVQEQDREIEFDIIGCHISLANAFRRILLSEVPSMAIEKVYIINNTSLIQDEVLAHRLGLVPLRADPRLFEYPPNDKKTDDTVSDNDTLRYELKVTCSMNPQAPKNSRLPEDMYKNSKVYSKDIKWVPIGRQAEMFKAEQIGILENDILICKMRPGHEIHLFMHAVKGIGKDHAKFSPVATASYRLLPVIQLIKPVKDQDADLLKSCFSPGVIEVVEQETNSGQKYREARVKNARYDSCSRNVYRYDQLKNCVEMSRIKDHFIFTIESVGTLPPAVLFTEAVKVLQNKCKSFLAELADIGN